MKKNTMRATTTKKIKVKNVDALNLSIDLAIIAAKFLLLKQKKISLKSLLKVELI